MFSGIFICLLLLPIPIQCRSHQHALVSDSLYLHENLQVFQSDLFCFQQPLDEILSRINLRKILFSIGHRLLNSVICGFWKSIRKQRFYTSFNVMVHYFFTKYIKFPVPLSRSSVSILWCLYISTHSLC